MQFIKSDLGYRQQGEVVEITLRGSAANVFLLDSANFTNYRNGRSYNYHGGLAKRSPIRLVVPRSGHWYAVVDMRGLRGQTNASFRVLPGALPEIREASLRSIPTLVHDDIPPGETQSEKEYDVFISHASEDKNEIVRPLAQALVNAGLNVWYDEFSLKIGDSLRKKIDQGLLKSKVGLVVFSQAFFKKGWTNYELDGIVTRSVSGEQVLLPIWHGVTKQQVIAFSPSLADKVARSTATHTVEEIAQEIAELIHGQEG